MGYSPWGHKGLDMTERLHFSVFEYLWQNTYYKGERSNIKKEKSGGHHLTWVVKVNVTKRGQSKCGHD